MIKLHLTLICIYRGIRKFITRLPVDNMYISLPLCIIVTLTQTLVTDILFDTSSRESQVFDINKETVYLLDIRKILLF